MRLSALLALLLTILPPTTCLHSPTPQSNPSTFPNTAEGFQNLINTIFKTIQDKDQPNEDALIHSMILPPDSTWLTDTYGNAFGTRMNTSYRAGQEDMEELIKEIYEKDVAKGYKNPTVQVFTDPEKVDEPVDRYLNSMDDIVPLYRASVNGDRFYATLQIKNGKTFYQTPDDPDGYFIYDRGAFRFIPRTVLAKLPEQRPMRITLDAKTMMMIKSVKEVRPPIPWDAVKKGLSGTVVIELVVAVDGTVKEAKIIEGNPILANPVLEAAKQYTFTPTTLDGDPVEVVVQIPFGFDFHRH